MFIQASCETCKLYYDGRNPFETPDNICVFAPFYKGGGCFQKMFAVLNKMDIDDGCMTSNSTSAAQTMKTAADDALLPQYPSNFTLPNNVTKAEREVSIE